MELSQLCTILGAAQSSNPQQRKAAEQTLLQVVFLATPLPHSAGSGLHAGVLANRPCLAGCASALNEWLLHGCYLAPTLHSM